VGNRGQANGGVSGTIDSDQDDDDDQFVRVATGYSNRDRMDSEDVDRRGRQSSENALHM
jgi:hypothetical protein